METKKSYTITYITILAYFLPDGQTDMSVSLEYKTDLHYWANSLLQSTPTMPIFYPLSISLIEDLC